MTPQPIMAVGNRSMRRHWIGSSLRHGRYNRSPVGRVEDLPDSSLLTHWKVLFRENNRGKRGHPFRTPGAFITFHARLRAFTAFPSGPLRE